MRRFVAVVAVAVGLVVLAPQTALAKSVPASQWAPKFCSAISNFQQQLSKDGDKADAVLSGNVTNLSQAKSTLVGFMNKAVEDADTARSELARAGTPKVVNGSKIAMRFVTAFQTARGLFATAKTDAERLPTKTLAGFEAATRKLTASLSKGSNALSSSSKSVQSLDTSGKVAAALRAEPKCAFLQNA
jgi:hypothetical protein